MTGVGRVLQIGDGVARVYGLRDAMMGEMIEFPNGVFGLAHNLEEDNVGCIVLGDYTGDQRRRPGQDHGPDHAGAGGRRRCWAAW